MNPKHSRFGASNAKRWISCPGSPALIAQCPEQPTSGDAALGTSAHALAEHCLRNHISADTCIGAEFEGHVVDAEMAEAVQVYLDEVAKWRERMPTAKLLIEERVDLSWIHPEMYGTADVVLVDPFGAAVVIDYKHGAGVPVEVIDNPQPVYYGLGAYFDHDCTRVTCVIVQPRCPHPDGPVREVTYNRAQLGEWVDKFQDAVAAALKPAAKLSAGEHCRFCPAAGACPEAHSNALRVAQAEFAPSIVPPAPHTLSPSQLATVLEHAGTIDAWITAVRMHALAVAQNGVPIPGYKLVEGRRGNRRWADEDLAAKALASINVDPYEQSVVSPAAAEKRIGKGGKAKLAELGHLIVQNPGKPELAPEVDKRIALAPSAISDFAKVSASV